MDTVPTDIPTEGIPLTESERRIWAEIAWAEQNHSQLLARYAGEWVALENRTVVAHGPDREEVLRAAAAATQRPEGEVAIWPIFDVTNLLSDASPGAGEM